MFCLYAFITACASAQEPAIIAMPDDTKPSEHLPIDSRPDTTSIEQNAQMIQALIERVGELHGEDAVADLRAETEEIDEKATAAADKAKAKAQAAAAQEAAELKAKVAEAK